MKDLKKIYADICNIGDNNIPAKFDWGEIYMGFCENHLAVIINGKYDEVLIMEVPFGASFEVFKNIYLKTVDERINRLKMEFEPMT